MAPNLWGWQVDEIPTEDPGLALPDSDQALVSVSDRGTVAQGVGGAPRSQHDRSFDREFIILTRFPAA